MVHQTPTRIVAWRGPDREPSLKTSNRVGLSRMTQEKAPDKPGAFSAEGYVGALPRPKDVAPAALCGMLAAVII